MVLAIGEAEERVKGPDLRGRTLLERAWWMILGFLALSTGCMVLSSVGRQSPLRGDRENSLFCFSKILFV